MNYIKIAELLEQPIGMSASVLQGAVDYLQTRIEGSGSAGSAGSGFTKDEVACGISTGALNGIGVMELSGTFVPRMLPMDAFCMGGSFISTNDATLAFADLASKHDTILLSIDSGGGSLTGVPELAEAIKNSTSKVIGFTDNTAASAAYWVLSACDEVVATPSAMVGNIGVYIPVMKRSTDETIKTHYFSAGAKKLYGATDVAITEAESQYFQGKVDATYGWFTEAVANYRNIDVNAVIETEAEAFHAKDVVGLLVDRLVNNIWEV